MTTESVGHPQSADEIVAWMRVPVFTEHWAGLSYPQRMAALDQAWERYDKTQQEVQRWTIVVAE